MVEKKPNNIKNFVNWIFGNTAWDLFKIVISSIFSGLITWTLSIQSVLSEWFGKMGIFTSIAIVVVIFFGFLFIALIVFSSIGLLITKSSSSDKSFAVPGISLPLNHTEYKRLFRVIVKVLDHRVQILKKAGIYIQKEVGKESSYSYKYYYKGNLVYHFSMLLRPDAPPNSIGFYDGWTEPKPKSFTAFGTIRSELGIENPMVLVSNLSLLDDIMPGATSIYSYEDLSELIWKKTSRIIEQRMSYIDPNKTKKYTH